MKDSLWEMKNGALNGWGVYRVSVLHQLENMGYKKIPAGVELVLSKLLMIYALIARKKLKVFCI